MSPALTPVPRMMLSMVSGDEQAASLEFSPDSTRLAVVGRGAKNAGITVYDAAGGRELFQCRETLPANDAVFQSQW